ncbi:C-type lectin domain family 1 member A-like [Alligator sinensis]|uniref:C-type lectin domain family 1 member A-like n=1 Tax=Alligator sinensis TaxID=38654 RepID=A0A3Q0FH26_ALLSI|nr:C-type lectin domain family 1 member A-like [Alligator sinensis]
MSSAGSSPPRSSHQLQQTPPGTQGQEDLSSHLWLGTSAKMQRQTRLPAGHRVPLLPSSSWLPLALALGTQVLCLLLLIGARVYDAMVTDWSREHKNLTEHLEYLSQQLMTCQPQSSGCPDMPQDLPPHQGEQCPSRWSRMEDKSYLFSPEKRTWAQCKSSCIPQAAELLVVENWEERNFINHELFQYYEERNRAVYYHRFWIGLSYNSETRKWVWVNGSELSSALFDLPDLSHASYEGGACVYVQGGAAKPGDCELTQFCICEKRRELSGEKRLD